MDTPTIPPPTLVGLRARLASTREQVREVEHQLEHAKGAELTVLNLRLAYVTGRRDALADLLAAEEIR